MAPPPAPVLPEAPPVEKKPIEVGMIDRVVRGVTNVIASARNAWMGPGEPIAPVAQVESRGRQFDYPVQYNARIDPRNGELVGFSQLRQLADAYYLVRLAIETRKDQMGNLKWGIRPRSDEPSEAELAEAEEVRRQLEFPDGEHNHRTWQRMALEDVLVIDALTIEPRRRLNGQPYSLDLVDGGTIVRKLDVTGRTPAPPEVAFQQVIKGVPANSLTTDELLYLPRNVRTNRVYGYSPVEQVLYIVNIALRRDVSKLQYYTEGTVPDAIAEVPAEWTTQQIREFQDYWDGITNNTAVKRKLRFIPALKQLHFTKPEIMKDAYDEWLARIVAFAFSIDPNALISQINRATGETLRLTALDDGTIACAKWWADVMNLILAKFYGKPHLEYVYLEEKIVDELKAAQANEINVRNGFKNLDTVREELGQEAVGVGAIFVTTAGVFTAEQLKNGEAGRQAAPAIEPDGEVDPAAEARDAERVEKMLEAGLLGKRGKKKS